MVASEESAYLTAYQIYDHATIGLQSAPVERDWMEAAPQRFPYRCLPLNIANQNGWVLTNPVGFRVYWYGGALTSDLEVRFDGPSDSAITSHFGSGVLTFSLPWVFRTPPGINLWVKGPANHIKDGIQPLEGVVETDWAMSTFTMNWKATRANEWISFAAGEPMCMIVPIPRGLTESLIPRIVPMKADPELHEQYREWERSRSGFLAGLKSLDQATVERGWQKDYFQGRTAAGDRFASHQTRLAVREFTSADCVSAPAKPTPTTE
ncbi:MAG: DUF6065 family protein [Bacteroidales bacterium]|nr:DUF6065 family protein [Bacteroidales bacterium]